MHLRLFNSALYMTSFGEMKGLGSKQSYPIQGTILLFACSD
jgi:hypothetical protein